MIYFCLPAYNEAATVGLSLYKIGEVMKHVHREYELIVLDDGSTDETLHVINSYGRILPLNVLSVETNRGFGPSVLTLLKEAMNKSMFPERDIVITIEADFSQDPTAVPSMVREIEGGADIVIASSFARGSSMSDTPFLFRMLNSALYLMMRNLYAISGVKDYVSSFRAYRVNLVKRALRRFEDGLITLSGRSANTELLLNMNSLDPKIVEVPLVFRLDARKRDSRVRVHKLWWEYVRMIARLWLTGRK